jgi:hypothetical protein
LPWVLILIKGKNKKRKRTIVSERTVKPTIFKPKDREWTSVDANKLFDDCVQKETGASDASTDTKSYGKLLWTFLGGTKKKKKQKKNI